MRRAALAVLLAGPASGQVMARAPSPHGSRVFWVGDLCAPWLALAFLAGTTQRRRLPALVLGVATELGCLAGFYAGVLSPDGPRSLGLPADASTAAYLQADLLQWLRFVAPWAVVAVGAGLVYGGLGQLWRTSRRTVGAAALALPFLAEPELWHLRRPDLQQPWAVWTLEAAVGLLAFVLLRRGRTPAPLRPPA